MIKTDSQIATSRIMSGEEQRQIHLDRGMEKVRAVYIRKRRRYYKLLDKKYRLMTEYEHLLGGSIDDIKRYCLLDAEAESKLNLKYARKAFRDAEGLLIRMGNDSGQYDFVNDFVRAALSTPS